MNNLAARIDNFLGLQRSDFILWAPVFLGLGAGLYFGCTHEPQWGEVIGAIMFGTAALFSLLRLQYKGKAHSLTGMLVILGLLLASLGFGLAKLKTQIVYTPILKREIGPVWVEGTIAYTEKLENERDTLFLLEDVKIGDLPDGRTPEIIRLTSRIRGDYYLGSRVKLLAKISPPSKPVMPDAYDFRRHYYFKSIGGIGFTLKPPEVISQPRGGFSYALERARHQVSERIRSLLEPRLSGIAAALVTGERAAIQEDDWDALRASGLAHIISISGLHVALIATAIFFTTRLIMAAIPRLALFYPIKKIAALIAFAAALGYVLFVVPSVPTYRALMMTGIGLIAIMTDRSPFSLRLLAVAAIAVLILSPESIWSASFQLSFAAVLALIVTIDYMRPFFLNWRSQGGYILKLTVYLLGSIITTLAISVITAPLVSFHFQQIPVYSVVANALSIPLSSLAIMPGVILLFILWPFGLEEWAVKFMGWGIDQLLLVAHVTADLPHAVIYTSGWPISALLLLSAVFLMITLMSGQTRWLAAPMTALAVLLIATSPFPAVIISESGKLALIRDGSNLYLSSRNKDKFAAETWLQRLGAQNRMSEILPREGKALLSNGEVVCGQGQCRIVSGGLKISFGDNFAAMAEDCDWAQIILTSTAFKHEKCAAQIYNKLELARNGAMTIMKDGRIKSLNYGQLKRPWSEFNDRFGSGSTTRPEFARGRD